MTNKEKARLVVEALEFYESPSNRGLKPMGTFNGGLVIGDALLMDKGEKAKQALPLAKELLEHFETPCIKNMSIQFTDEQSGQVWQFKDITTLLQEFVNYKRQKETL